VNSASKREPTLRLPSPPNRATCSYLFHPHQKSAKSPSGHFACPLRTLAHRCSRAWLYAARPGSHALFQPRENLGAIAVRQSMVHDGAREPIVLNQNRRLENRRRHGGVRASLFQRPHNMQSNEELVFDYQDRASSERGMFHVQCAAKGKMPEAERSCSDGVQCPEPSIDPQRATSAMIDWRKAMTA
jgi:hypothetical protein